MKHAYRVYCQWCSNWHSTEDVEFLNIEEDIQGNDVMHFRCNSKKSWNEADGIYEGASSKFYKE